jgi:hypothetical protein
MRSRLRAWIRSPDASSSQCEEVHESYSMAVEAKRARFIEQGLKQAAAYMLGVQQSRESLFGALHSF